MRTNPTMVVRMPSTSASEAEWSAVAAAAAAGKPAPISDEDRYLMKANFA